jgi:hypothetical protein
MVSSAGPVMTLDPASGNVFGQPGSSASWNFSLTGDPTNWVSVTTSILLFETNPALGSYQDSIGLQNGPVDGAVPPGTVWTGQLALYFIDPGAQIGDSDSGTVRVLYDVFSGDPQTCGGCLTDSGFLDSSVTVTAGSDPSPAPEPGSWFLIATGLALVAGSRVYNSLRRQA